MYEKMAVSCFTYIPILETEFDNESTNSKFYKEHTNIKILIGYRKQSGGKTISYHFPFH